MPLRGTEFPCSAILPACNVKSKSSCAFSGQFKKTQLQLPAGGYYRLP